MAEGLHVIDIHKDALEYKKLRNNILNLIKSIRYIHSTGNGLNELPIFAFLRTISYQSRPLHHKPFQACSNGSYESCRLHEYMGHSKFLFNQ